MDKQIILQSTIYYRNASMIYTNQTNQPTIQFRILQLTWINHLIETSSLFLEKAFDKLNHTQVPNDIAVTGNVCDLFCNYISESIQFVKFEIYQAIHRL